MQVAWTASCLTDAANYVVVVSTKDDRYIAKIDGIKSLEQKWVFSNDFECSQFCNYKR